MRPRRKTSEGYFFFIPAIRGGVAMGFLPTVIGLRYQGSIMSISRSPSLLPGRADAPYPFQNVRKRRLRVGEPADMGKVLNLIGTPSPFIAR